MYGVVPPVAFTVAVPSAALRQVSLVEEIISAIKSVGSSTVCSSTTSQPLLSTTIKAYWPADKLFTVSGLFPLTPGNGVPGALSCEPSLKI